MPDMLVSVSNALETLMIPVVNSDYRPFEDQLIQHMDNVFDPMICLSLVAPSATSWPLRSTGEFFTSLPMGQTDRRICSNSKGGWNLLQANLLQLPTPGCRCTNGFAFIS
ncbi:hypothetical protein MG293_011656 [Ovis ammon polii]|uniref:Uncharacterized protein n=1 Tax=Ovis ammon polii TaxID=230172 RepID=A0AAD4U2E9_OVIAM|nr:hypothetical protein MG293_011656 [Ovis ammon polii]